MSNVLQQVENKAEILQETIQLKEKPQTNQTNPTNLRLLKITEKQQKNKDFNYSVSQMVPYFQC